MKNLICILSLLCPVFAVQAQFCTGNVGVNIFLDGDFGSGPSNILATDPGIAPGFFYNPVAPPYDGEYILTNDIGDWTYDFNWLQVEEKSDDPDGYMMVVNASFEPGLFYNQLVEGLCPNTLYEFTADIINVIKPGSNLLKPNVSFLLDGEEAISTGSIPEDAQWHTYGFTFTTAPDQTSVELSLRNNAPGGIGNDLALDNILFRACGPEAYILPEETDYLCLDGSPLDLEVTIVGEQYPSPTFQWQQSFDEGLTWDDMAGANNTAITHNDFSSGFYYYRFLVANNPDNLENDKCRVNSNSKVVRILPEQYEVVDSICSGLSFEVGDKTYSASGIYVDTLVSFYGCDSIMTLNLSVVQNPGLDVLIDKQDPSCSYSYDGFLAIDSVLNGVGPYTVYLDSALFEAPWQLGTLNTGNYNLDLYDRYGCYVNKNIEIIRPDSFTLNLGADLETELGTPVTISSVSNYPIAAFEWFPENIIDCETDCDNELVYFNTSTTLIAEVTNDFGCITRDSVFILVDSTRKVFFPNIISANNDGINDSFTIYGAVPNVQLVRSLEIYDRWGAKIYSGKNIEVNDESAGWNPQRFGGDFELGTYVYLAEIEFFDGAVLQYTGSFTVNK